MEENKNASGDDEWKDEWKDDEEWKKDFNPPYQRQGYVYLTPFARMLIPNSELACDGPEASNTILLLNFAGFAVLGLGCVCIPQLATRVFPKIRKVNNSRQQLPFPNKFVLAITGTMTSSAAASIYLWCLAKWGMRPRIIQWQEEHVSQRLKEMDGDVPKGIRAAFGEEAFEKFRHGPTFDFLVFAGFIAGSLGGGALARWRLSRIMPVTSEQRFMTFTSYIPPASLAGIILGCWSHQPLTGGFAVRKRLREHLLKVQETEESDLERLQLIEARRAKRLAQIKEMTSSERYTWSSILNDAAATPWDQWNLLREREKNKTAGYYPPSKAELLKAPKANSGGLPDNHPLTWL